MDPHEQFNGTCQVPVFLHSFISSTIAARPNGDLSMDASGWVGDYNKHSPPASRELALLKKKGSFIRTEDGARGKSPKFSAPLRVSSRSSTTFHLLGTNF